MSVSNPNLSVSRQDLADFYDKIFPYLGGKAAAGFTPVGTIISVMGVNAPANYLKCDGTVYNISDYPELARYFGQQFSMINKFGGDGTTTFAVPDLRGEFLRGTGTNSHSSQGNGAAVGTHQNGTIVPEMRANDSGVIYATKSSISEYDFRGLVGNRVSISSTGGDTYGYGYTLRPTNTSVLYCIATKNIYMNPSLDYSTDEKVVGNWVDGKPLYQKTIAITVPNATTEGTEANVTYTITSDEISWAWIIESTGSTPVQTDMNILQVSSSVHKLRGVRLFYSSSLKKLYVGNNSAAYNGLTAYVTVRYTKTTD